MRLSSKLLNDCQPQKDLGDLIGRHDGCTCAIIGTGMSLEGFDFSRIQKDCAANHEHVWTVGMNESVKLLDPDYCVIADHSAFQKSWMHLSAGNTRLVLHRKIWESQKVAPHYDPRSGATSIHKLSDLEEFYIADFGHDEDRDPRRTIYYSMGILTGALSLAAALGMRRVFLYGVDMYRTMGEEYHCAIGPAKKENLESTDREGYYTAPSYRAMIGAVEKYRGWWRSMDIVNMSRYSMLKTFPIDPVHSLPAVGG